MPYIINSTYVVAPVAALTIIVIGDANGIYEQTFIMVLSALINPTILKKSPKGDLEWLMPLLFLIIIFVVKI